LGGCSPNHLACGGGPGGSQHVVVARQSEATNPRGQQICPASRSPLGKRREAIWRGERAGLRQRSRACRISPFEPSVNGERLGLELQVMERGLPTTSGRSGITSASASKASRWGPGVARRPASWWLRPGDRPGRWRRLLFEAPSQPGATVDADIDTASASSAAAGDRVWTERYGADKVAQIITFTADLEGVLKDVAGVSTFLWRCDRSPLILWSRQPANSPR